MAAASEVEARLLLSSLSSKAGSRSGAPAEGAGAAAGTGVVAGLRAQLDALGAVGLAQYLLRPSEAEGNADEGSAATYYSGVGERLRTVWERERGSADSDGGARSGASVQVEFSCVHCEPPPLY